MAINSIGTFLGRFQPPTIAHQAIINKIASMHDLVYIFVVAGKKTSKDKDLNPLPAEYRQKLLNKITPPNVTILVFNTGFIPDALKQYDINADKVVLYCGPDRFNEYKKFTGYMDNLTVQQFNFKRAEISATKARVAIRTDNEKIFQTLVPRELWGDYQNMRSWIVSGHEKMEEQKIKPKNESRLIDFLRK